MCGIVGILNLEHASGRSDIAPSVIARMLGAVAHRGPDDSGSVTRRVPGAEVALGHSRLSILDLSAAGHQPMADERAGSWITFNGEIYNFRELRQGLSEADDQSERAWSSGTDTEVILRAYRAYGAECLARLRGMFAFAVWDERDRSLLIARDRLGIKPLYYYQGDGFFLFASEVRAILESGLVPRRLDPVAASQYLHYQSVPAPRTMIEGVSALEPGSWLRVAVDAPTTRGQYWDLLGDADPAAADTTLEGAKARVSDLLRESTALHMVSDVPVSAFLSGGIDSSAVVALMREAGATPRTFSVVFSEAEYDEAAYAKLIAEKFRTEHTEVLLTSVALLDQLRGALGAMDQPTGDGVNTYVVSAAVRDAGMKVALSGLGGDEIFGGYPSFRRMARTESFARVWRNAPASLRALASRTVRTLGPTSVRAEKIAGLVAGDASLALAYPLTRQVLSDGQRDALLGDKFVERTRSGADPYVELLRGAFDVAGDAGLMSRVSYAEGRTYMHDVLLRDTDQMSMAHALEVRVPLLDHRLVEYVMGLPDAIKRERVTAKQLLVDSLGDLLPEEIYRRPKRGFTLPFASWMSGPLREFCEERLDPGRVEARGIFRASEVTRLWSLFLANHPAVSWSRLWVIVVLEDWLERNGVSTG